jgi:hypothetical protein
MADSIKYSISAKPIETISADQGSVKIVSTEIKKNLGGSGEVTLSSNYETITNSTHGYTNGIPYYIEAGKIGFQAFPTLASVKFIFIKHSGFIGASSGAKSAVRNTTDYLTITAGSSDTVIIAILKPEESIALPVRGGATFQSFRHKSTNSGGSNSGSNTIAVEFLGLI